MSDQRIIWLASFPKSGNTWMRYLLAHYFMPKSEAPDINNIRRFTTADVRQDFFASVAGKDVAFNADFDTWLKIRTPAIGLIARSRPGTHFVKTHCQIMKIGSVDIIPPQYTAAAIYLMRNPFDVAQSYASHLSVDLDTAIDMMMDQKTMNQTGQGIFEITGRWDDHLKSWINAPGLPLHVMRYEDMQSDAERALRTLFGFLRAPIDDGKMRRAIREASFKNMSKQEQQLGFREKPQNMDRFFRKGVSGSWRSALTPGQIGRLREAFLPTLERYYPEMLEETASLAVEG